MHRGAALQRDDVCRVGREVIRIRAGDVLFPLLQHSLRRCQYAFILSQLDRAHATRLPALGQAIKR